MAALLGMAAYNGASFLAQPPKPNSLLDWLVFLLIPACLTGALILGIVIGVPLLRGGYPKPRAAPLPVIPLRWASFVLVLAPLCLFRFGYLTRRDVIYFFLVAGQTFWLSNLETQDIEEPDA